MRRRGERMDRDCVGVCEKDCVRESIENVN